MKHLYSALFAIVLASVAAVPGNAGILTTSAGVTVLASPPASTQLDQLESNTDVFVFQERSDYGLPLPTLVDASSPGSYDVVADLTPSILPTGLVVNSYLVHADPDVPLLPFIGVPYLDRSITFDPTERIVGIMVDAVTLRVSDPFLGAPGTNYPPLPIFSGLELDLVDGPIIISPDGRTITVNFSVGTGLDFGGVDQVRVLTAVTPVPEPLTSALTLCGIAVIFGARAVGRRRQ